MKKLFNNWIPAFAGMTMWRILTVTHIYLTCALLTITAQASSPAKFNVSEGFADLVEPLTPAVVNISTTQKAKKSSGNRFPFDSNPLENFNQFFEQFMGPNWGLEDEGVDSRKLVSLGSGFIVDSEGYIVTNYHVIAEADEIAVKLHGGGKELIAKLIGADKKTDTALLKVDNNNKPLPFVKFGDSDKSRVGDWIITIGNPFGLGSTVTSGIISANGRDISSEGIVDNFIQTDAAINRGNSGGPMFNTQGEVIGINTIILSPSGGNIGIGFATPSSIIMPVIEQLKATGKVKRGILGVKLQPITDDISDSLGLDSTDGALIVEVAKKSSAAKAGLAVGDILIAVNDQQIKTARQFVKIASTTPVGKEIALTIMRNGKKEVIKATLVEDKESEIEVAMDSDQNLDVKKDREKRFSQFGAKEIKGAYLAKLDSILREKYGIDNSINGLIILGYNKKSSWYTKGFRQGDVVISANQTLLTSSDQLNTIFKTAKSTKKKSVLLLISRNNVQMFISFPVE